MTSGALRSAREDKEAADVEIARLETQRDKRLAQYSVYEEVSGHLAVWGFWDGNGGMEMGVW